MKLWALLNSSLVYFSPQLSGNITGIIANRTIEDCLKKIVKEVAPTHHEFTNQKRGSYGELVLDMEPPTIKWTPAWPLVKAVRKLLPNRGSVEDGDSNVR